MLWKRVVPAPESVMAGPVPSPRGVVFPTVSVNVVVFVTSSVRSCAPSTVSLKVTLLAAPVSVMVTGQMSRKTKSL